MAELTLLCQENTTYLSAINDLLAALLTGVMRESIFRMYTKSRDVLYISNNVYMVLDMWTKKAKFIISINDVLKY